MSSSESQSGESVAGDLLFSAYGEAEIVSDSPQAPAGGIGRQSGDTKK